MAHVAGNDSWSFADEVMILEAIVDMSDLEGRHPSLMDLHLELHGRLMRENASPLDLAKKKHNLKTKFRRTLEDGGPQQGGERNQKLFELSKKVWPDILEMYPHAYDGMTTILHGKAGAGGEARDPAYVLQEGRRALQ
ncbi:hypothetical protein EJB05_46983, partial [Eragrostis curvula]